jgi:hypothetical protein
MSGDDGEGHLPIKRLVQSMVDDILDASSEDILAECRAEGGDPERLAAEFRARLESTMLKARKARLASARAGLAASQATPRRALGGIENARSKLARVLAACPPDVKLTLAARNQSELSEADVLGMLEDLAELGISVPDDDQGRA